MRVAVAGGTGTVGTYVVSALEESGHQVVVLTRGHAVNLLTGDGLDKALVGVESVIDVSNLITMSRKKSVAFFQTVTTNLLAAEERAGVRHHVALSIVGIDRVNYGYYEGKRRQEELVLGGAVPSSVLRATQFHEFAGQVLAEVPPGPVAVIPRMRLQPIAAMEAADALVAIALGSPVGIADELAGPREETLPDMARRLLKSRGDRRVVMPLRLPVAGAKEMANGDLLPAGHGAHGQQTFDEWLAANEP